MDNTFNEIGVVLEDAKKLAVKYKQLTGKDLGITGEVAEYEAAKKLKAKLCIARTPGHDLIDCNDEKVQVKGRVYKRQQRVGTISESTEKKPWNYVLLVLLNEDYNPIEFYKASKEEVEVELNRDRPKGGKKRRDMTVQEFIKIAIRII